MKMQRVNITLPYEILRELQTTIPNGKRSKFIAKVLSEKLTHKKNIRQALKKSLRENKTLYEKAAKEWKYTQSEWPR